MGSFESAAESQDAIRFHRSRYSKTFGLAEAQRGGAGRSFKVEPIRIASRIRFARAERNFFGASGSLSNFGISPVLGRSEGLEDQNHGSAIFEKGLGCDEMNLAARYTTTAAGGPVAVPVMGKRVCGLCWSAPHGLPARVVPNGDRGAAGCHSEGDPARRRPKRRMLGLDRRRDCTRGPRKRKLAEFGDFARSSSR